jgi:DNA-binding GntR family transcriptional regulator
VELADALGMSEVHTSRTMRRLQREGLIDADHRTIRIPDLEALKAAGGFDADYLHLEGASRAVLGRLSAEVRPR